MDEICVAKFDVYECRKSDRASALSGAQLNICAEGHSTNYPLRLSSSALSSEMGNIGGNTVLIASREW